MSQTGFSIFFALCQTMFIYCGSHIFFNSHLFVEKQHFLKCISYILIVEKETTFYHLNDCTCRILSTENNTRLVGRKHLQSKLSGKYHRSQFINKLQFIASQLCVFVEFKESKPGICSQSRPFYHLNDWSLYILLHSDIFVLYILNYFLTL